MNGSDISTEQSPQVGALTPLIDPHLAAVWGAFLHEGLMLNPSDPQRTFQILDVWGNGCVELINALAEIVPIIWEQIHPHWHRPQGFPGVFEYEVVSALGEQLGSYMLENDGNLPSSEEVEDMAAALIATFFSFKQRDSAVRTVHRIHVLCRLWKQLWWRRTGGAT